MSNPRTYIDARKRNLDFLMETLNNGKFPPVDNCKNCKFSACFECNNSFACLGCDWWKEPCIIDEPKNSQFQPECVVNDFIRIILEVI